MLYYLIVQVVLPEYYPHQHIRLSSSAARAVLFLDCDNNFDIHRFRRVASTYIKDKFAESLQGGFIHHAPVQTLSPEEVDPVVTTALSNIYVFQPSSGIALLSTLKGLTHYLSRPEHENVLVGLICIDSITAFHNVLRSTDMLSDYYLQLATTLRSLSTLFGVPVITTSWALFAQNLDQLPQGRGYLGVGPSHPHSTSTHRPIWRHYFPGEWLRAVDRRIILQKKEIRGFLSGMMLVEAEMEKEKRMEVVKRGAIMGWVEDDEGKEFEMFITDEGVRFAT